MLIFTYHQVMPCFLEFVFPFARQLYATDFHFGGFRSQLQLGGIQRGLYLPKLDWSGESLRICYNLKGPEMMKVTDPEEWPWYLGQCAVHHSFDLQTGKATWVVLVKGNVALQRQVKSATEDRKAAGLRLESLDQSFRATLETHMIFCEWSSQSWRWYINFLYEKVHSFSNRAVFTPVEAPVPSSQRNSNISLRYRQGRHSSNGDNSEGSSVNILKNPPVNPAPPFSLENGREYLATTQAALGRSIRESSKQDALSFGDLQGLHAIEEMVNKANLGFKVNQNVLTDLKTIYGDCEDTEDWPEAFRGICHQNVVIFAARISMIQKDMAIQQFRIEQILRLIADRKSLVCMTLSLQMT